MSDKEQLECIERQFRLWGLEGLTKEGEDYWTEKVDWLIQKVQQIEVVRIENEQLKNDLRIAKNGWRL
jgi:hypothetical protein